MNPSECRGPVAGFLPTHAALALVSSGVSWMTSALVLRAEAGT